MPIAGQVLPFLFFLTVKIFMYAVNTREIFTVKGKYCEYTHKSQYLKRNIFTNEEVKILISHADCFPKQEINIDFGA